MFKSDIWLLVWIGLVAFVAYTSKLKKTETVLGQQTERYSLFFAVIVFLPVFFFVTTGEMRGDVWTYINGFNLLNMSVSDVIKIWGTYDKGPAFLLVEVLIKQVFGNDRNAFRMIIGLLQSIPLVLIYRKYSEDYVLSIFLFITSGCYIGWMMNGLRQFIAACIIFCAFPLLIKKKYIPLLLVVLLAMMFHKSALLMIPVIFIVQLKPWGKINILCMLMFAVLLYFYIQNSDWMSEEGLQAAKGSNPLRIMVNAIPVVIAFVGRKAILKQGDRIAYVCINFSIITVVIYVVASFTSGIMTGRLPGYTVIYNYILIPYLCKKVFNENSSKNLRLFFIIFYLAYFMLVIYQSI